MESLSPPIELPLVLSRRLRLLLSKNSLAFAFIRLCLFGPLPRQSSTDVADVIAVGGGTDFVLLSPNFSAVLLAVILFRRGNIGEGDRGE